MDDSVKKSSRQSAPQRGEQAHGLVDDRGEESRVGCQEPVRLHHLFWADNLYLIARGHGELQRMLRDVTAAMDRVAMAWKPSSLVVLWGASVQKLAAFGS